MHAPRLEGKGKAMAVKSSQVSAPAPSVADQAKSCDVCGNLYDKSFEVRLADRNYTFDCFECAIHRLAPKCAHCHCRVIGHGVESNGIFFCCAHCARREGEASVRDRVEGE